MEGGWDELFDESYMLLYAPSLSEERTRAEAEAVVRFAAVPPGAEILDCPCGFARHALVLSEAGYSVTGVDRSEVQLAEAERRRGGAEWPRLVHADYREYRGSFSSRSAGFAAHFRRDRDPYLMKSISEYFGSGHRSSATTFSSRSATLRTFAIAVSCESRA